MEYEQFKNLKIPSDIKPLEVFDRASLQKELKRSVNISKTLVLSINTSTFRPNEVHVHTADIGSTYEPDFDFSDLDEIDAWRKTCRLKYSLQRFQDVNAVRCENFLHKMQICESLTLFEEIHRMLRSGGFFIITVLDILKLINRISKDSNNLTNLYYYEKLLFSAGDSTGVYFNRTIWTFDRFNYYLKKAKFAKVELTENKDSDLFSLLATKE